MPALAEIRQLGRRIQAAIPHIDIFPRPATPQDKIRRLPSVETLSIPDNQTLFSMVRNLTKDFGERGDWCEGLLRLPVNLDEILASQHLPEELKRYMQAPFTDTNFAQRWVNPKVWLAVERNFPDGTPGRFFQIGLGIGAVQGVADDLGLHVSGWIADYPNRIPPHYSIPTVHLQPSNFENQYSDLFNSTLKPNYEALKQYAETNPPLQTAKALVAFTIDTLRTPKK